MDSETKFIVAAFIIIALIVGGIEAYLNWFAPAWYCHLIGLGGINHVPANCIKYFIK